MAKEKRNIQEFNLDVKENEGYLYTTNPSLSAVLANARISDAVKSHIVGARSLVDIGCGDGSYTAEFVKEFPNLAVEAFDPAAEAIAVARERYPRITFSVQNILDDHLAVPGNPFDVGVLRGVLHHLSDQRKAIANALRLARMVIIVEPNGNNPVLKIIEKVSPYHRLHEEQSFTYRRIRGWCEQAGGVIVTHEYIGFVPFFFPDFLARSIYALQPFLEKIPVVRECLSAQVVVAVQRSTQE